MPGEIIKTIKIDVNSSEYKALLRSTKQLDKIEKEIEKSKKLTAKSIEEIISNKKKELDYLLKEGKINKELYKSKVNSLEVEKKDLILQQKRVVAMEKVNKAAEKANKLARETAFYKKKQDIDVAENKRGFDAQRKEWQKGSETSLQKLLKYKGLRGFFDSKIDKISLAGQKEVEGIDEQIAREEGKKALNQAEIDKLQDEINSGTLKGKKLTTAKNRINELENANRDIDNDKIENLKNQKAKSMGNTASQINKIKTMGLVAGAVAGVLKKLTKVVGDAVHQMIEFKTGVATYNTQTSLVTNATAREQQMKYGLTGSQNYAFTQAKSMLNIQSDEDLMYMNKDQRDKFLSYMNRYSQWYDKMEQSGVLADIQEMQLEFNELKQEIAMEFLQWVAENKDTIMTCIKGLFEVGKGIATVVMKIMEVLSFGKYKGSESQDIKSDRGQVSMNYGGNKNTTININANTTNNATGVLGSQQAMDQYSKENFNKMAKQIAGFLH